MTSVDFPGADLLDLLDIVATRAWWRGVAVGLPIGAVCGALLAWGAS